MRKLLGLLVLALLFIPSPLWASVAVDATMTGGNSSDGFNQHTTDTATSISSTGITVGSGATLLVGMLSFAAGSIVGPTSVTMTWNGVSMTQQVYIKTTGTTPQATSVIFTLVSPASGAQTLSASWTTSQECYMSAISFTGTDTTTGVNTADNTSVQQTTSLTITSTTDGATVANFAVNGATPTVNFTKIWAESSRPPGGGGTYNLGGTSNAHTFTGAGGTKQAIAGVHVIAGASSPSGKRPIKYGAGGC